MKQEGRRWRPSCFMIKLFEVSLTENIGYISAAKLFPRPRVASNKVRIRDFRIAYFS